jgi:hypothetical protein
MKRIEFICMRCGASSSKLSVSFKSTGPTCTTCLKRAMKRDTTPALEAIKKNKQKVREKREATMLERHGRTSNVTEDFKKQRTLEKYGVENAAKLDFMRDKFGSKWRDLFRRRR